MSQETSQIERPDGKPSKLQMLMDEIGVEGKTAERFKSVYLKYQEKRMALKKSGGKPNVMMQGALKLRDEQNAKMEDILSNEQYQKYLIAIKDKMGRPTQSKLEKPEAPVK